MAEGPAVDTSRRVSLNLLLTPVRQHIYPFRTVFGWLAGK